MTGKTPPIIFNRSLVRRRRARAAKSFADAAFLHERAMDDIVDRLETVNRTFETALICGGSHLANRLTSSCGVRRIIAGDAAANRLSTTTAAVVFEEEALPFAQQKFELIISLLTLHSVNDIVGALTQARLCLKPDGLFIAAAFGETTLSGLRQALYAAEAEISGGVSLRIAPFAGVQDFGAALGRAGFTLPVVDIDKVSVNYRDPGRLLRDLRGMGETQALASQPPPLRPRVLQRALENLAEAGGKECFDIVYLTGWAPHESQQKPLPPGAGKASLEQAMKGS